MKIKDLKNAPEWLVSAFVADEDVEIDALGRLIWHSGEWRGGAWLGGVWHSGEWLGGVWHGGVWHGGEWHDGAWLGGVWHSGEWHDGVWRGGEPSVTVRDDLWAVLSSAPKESQGLRNALAEGRVNGSTYEGKCACLIGTIANVRQCKVTELGILTPNSSRPIEGWFMGIKTGDLPETNMFSKWALQWTDEWIANMRETFGVSA